MSLDDVIGPLVGDAQRRYREAAFENTIVRYVLQTTEAPRWVYKEMMDRCALYTRERKLRFQDLREFAPLFPAFLGTSTLCGLPVPGTTRVTPDNYMIHRDTLAGVEANRFKHFMKMPYVTAFRDLQEAAGNTHLPLGLVFPRKGFKYGMIIHDEPTGAWWDNGLALVYKYNHRGYGTTLYIQPFTEVAKAIARNFRWD